MQRVTPSYSVSVRATCYDTPPHMNVHVVVQRRYALRHAFYGLITCRHMIRAAAHLLMPQGYAAVYRGMSMPNGVVRDIMSHG